MPTNPATLPVTARRAPSAGAPPNGAALAARSSGLSLSGLSSPNRRQATDSSFPNLLADALQGAEPATSQALLSGVGSDSLSGSTLPSLASLGGSAVVPGPANSNPLAGLVNSGTSALGGALSGLGNLASLFGVGATTAPLSPAQKQSGEKAVETALGYLGRYDWNNYCERFVEVCYGTKNLYPNAASAGRALVTHKGLSALGQAPVGAILYFGANASNQYQGHAGLYLGDGRMVSATPNGVKMERVDSPAYSGQFVGWAEPGSFGQGRVTSATSLSPGSDPRTLGTARIQPTSRLGSATPPTIPRASAGSVPSIGTRQLSGGPTNSARPVSVSSANSSSSAVPVARRASAPPTESIAGVAQTQAAVGALPVLQATAPEPIVARPIAGAASVAPPLPLTARAVAGSRAPVNFGASNPLSPLAAISGSTLNRRA